MKKRIIIFSFLALLSLSGCRLIESGMARITTDFMVLSSDDRILYEKGAGPLAEEVARYLSQAVITVESKQYGKFNDPVRVYIFASTKSFSAYAGVSEVPKGASWENKIFLSPKLNADMSQVRGMLIHELSHIQLVQTLGSIKYNRNLPRWFREGLAIYLADGGGATDASEAEAVEQFLKGRHFTPETEGALFSQKFSGSEGLEPKIFYRQSGMFVRFIAEEYSEQFSNLLKGLQEGKDFKTQFAESFELYVGEMFQSFIEKLEKT